MMPASKSAIRREILSKRQGLTREERRLKSLRIAELLDAQPEYRDAGTVLFYVNFREEVATRGMIESAIAKGKKVLVPKVDHKAHRLKLYEIHDLARDLTCGYMNIYEPVEAVTRPASAAEADLVIMPGVGFNVDGRRLGYGGGYYDRLIEALRPDARLVALAFEVQMVDEIPCEEHDKKVHKIITEERVITA
ncbi:MAG: 5-formyltetrahydrofolate cyclo-ligase [Nitrospirota bacterium]